MPRQSEAQKSTMERVMHEYKQGDLKSGKSSKKVTNRRQAIAIGLSEAGASKYASKTQNERNLKRTKIKKRAGQAAGRTRSTIDR